MRAGVLPFSVSPHDWRPPTPPDLSRYDTIYLDTETTGLDWARGDRPVGIAVRTPDGKSWYLPFGHVEGNLDEALVRRWALSELRRKRIVGLNLRFDVHMLRVWGCDLRAQGCTFHDIAHAEAILDDHARGFSLEAISQRRLGYGKLDSGPKENIAWEPAGVIAPYAERDVELPHLVDEAQRPLLAAEGLERVMALEDSVIPVVVEMEANGAPLDLDLLERWERSSAKLLDRLHHEMYALAGFTVNPDAPSDMCRLWLKCGETVHRTEKGAPSFAAPIVQDAATRHPAIELVWRIGKLIDLRNKYLVKYLKDQIGGKLYPRFNQTATDEGGTVSGRFSSTAPNVQQVMGKDKHARAYGWLKQYGEDDYLIRRLFVPERGAWLCADAAQVEFRLFTHYSKSPRLLAKYAEDPTVSFHKIVGRDIIGPVRPDLEYTKVKVFNFTGIYGGGVGAAASVLGMSVEDAQPAYDAYHDLFPEARELLNEASRVAGRRGYVKTALGRRARFSPGDRYYSALNRVIQGTAADDHKMMLVETYKQRQELGLTMRITCHDELDADLLEPDRLPRVEQLLNEQRLDLRVPILFEVGIGNNWAEAKA